MRILLSVQRRLPRGPDEHGAIAIIVALLMVTLIGLSAFSVDIASAYATKRQLSGAADAAALAAAADYASTVGETCAQLQADSSLLSKAQTDAYDAFTSNLDSGYFASAAADPQPSGVAGTTLGLTCSPNGSSLYVTFSDAAVTMTVLAGIFGTQQIPTGRTATAAVSPSDIGTGLRPIGICMSTASAQAVITHPDQVVPVFFPDPVCNPQPGTWAVMRCPEQNTSSKVTLAADLYNGCRAPVTVDSADADGAVDLSPDANELLATDPADSDLDEPNTTNQLLIDATLDAGCNYGYPGVPPAPANCLHNNTGNGFDSGSKGCPSGGPQTGAEALFCLVDNPAGPVTVLFPVFYPGSIYPAPSYKHYPVYGLIGATICGFGANSTGGNAITTAGVCSGATVPAVQTTPDYLLLRFHSYESFGTTAPTCSFAAACDGGDRQVTLVR